MSKIGDRQMAVVDGSKYFGWFLRARRRQHDLFVIGYSLSGKTIGNCMSESDRLQPSRKDGRRMTICSHPGGTREIAPGKHRASSVEPSTGNCASLLRGFWETAFRLAAMGVSFVFLEIRAPDSGKNRHRSAQKITAQRSRNHRARRFTEGSEEKNLNRR